MIFFNFLSHVSKLVSKARGHFHQNAEVTGLWTDETNAFRLKLHIADLHVDQKNWIDGEFDILII